MTHMRTFRLPCSLPFFGRLFVRSDPRAVSDVSRTRNCEKWDISAVRLWHMEWQLLSEANAQRLLKQHFRTRVRLAASGLTALQHQSDHW